MTKQGIGTRCVQAGYTPENGGPRQILIPHRSIYSYREPQTASQDNGPVRPGPQPRRMSCLTMVLITMFFMFLIKACGG